MNDHGDGSEEKTSSTTDTTYIAVFVGGPLTGRTELRPLHGEAPEPQLEVPLITADTQATVRYVLASTTLRGSRMEATYNLDRAHSDPYWTDAPCAWRPRSTRS